MQANSWNSSNISRDAPVPLFETANVFLVKYECVKSLFRNPVTVLIECDHGEKSQFHYTVM